MRRKIFISMVVVMILLFTIMPAIVSEGAKDGLLLWFIALVPSLLPFMILSNMLIKLKVTKYINKFLKPLFNFVFGVSSEGSYPILIGFLAGCPMGAKTTAQLYKNAEIKKEEAQYLMTFCNNLSPMFLIEFIGVKCLEEKEPFLVLAVVAGSAVINAWICRLKTMFASKHLSVRRKNGTGLSKKMANQGKLHSVYAEKSERKQSEKTKEKDYRIMEAIDESIGDSCETILKIGGYIILFSIITSIIEYIIPAKYDIIGCLAAGILEVSTGAMQMSEISGLSDILLFDIKIKTLITVSMCAFGGISSVAQTYSVVAGTDLSIKYYMMLKIRQAFIAVVLALLVFRI